MDVSVNKNLKSVIGIARPTSRTRSTLDIQVNKQMPYIELHKLGMHIPLKIWFRRATGRWLLRWPRWENFFW